LKKIIKNIFKVAGLKIEKSDPLEDAIPIEYNHSPFLPRIYKESLDRCLYFLDMVNSVKSVDGDIVECGISIGHGALMLSLMGDYIGHARNYHGFDSFEGFPTPDERDEKTPITGKGYWSNPPEVVYKVLRNGGLSENFIESNIHLHKGWFNDTLDEYYGNIALLHLDCDLFDSYKLCLEKFYNKVSLGGVIMFDEYNDSRWPGATKAIDEFFADKPEKIHSHEKMHSKYYVRKV
jgi:hypothetical protein